MINLKTGTFCASLCAVAAEARDHVRCPMRATITSAFCLLPLRSRVAPRSLARQVYKRTYYISRYPINVYTCYRCQKYI